MAAKPKPVPSIPVRHQCVDAMLALAATGGWAAVTMPAIAHITGLRLSDLRALYRDRRDLLADWNTEVDERALANAGDGGSARERLFDLLMERFDALNDHRDGALAIIRDLPRDPAAAGHALKLTGRSMRWLLDAADIDSTRWRGAARVAALTVIYLRAQRVWCGDDSADMGTTMAALDRDLTRAQDWGARFGFDT